MSKDDSDATPRYHGLDILRGFAVMGILFMNIVAFAMPEIAYISPASYGGNTGPDFAAWLLSFILVDGKMRGIFSLLFGASMMLIITNAREKQMEPGKVHYRRMIWLCIFGLLHFYLIWWGDILFLYAVSGSLAYLFHHLSPKKLIKWALIIYAAGFLLMFTAMGAMLFLESAAKAPGADKEIVAEYNTLIADLGGDRQKIAKDVALHKGSYLGIVRSKLRDGWVERVTSTLLIMLETLPLMLIGMALLQNGFLLGQASMASYRKWAVWCISIGAILTCACAYFLYAHNFDLLLTTAVQMAVTIPMRLMMTVGYVAALVMLTCKYQSSTFMIRVAATGRAAFTNYLGTSIVMTTIFYGYGLGLYGDIGRAQLYWFVLGGCALMLIWSKPWLERFHYGPMEWLWRSLARWEMQPMRR
jgi:uncharacterized protein